MGAIDTIASYQGTSGATLAAGTMATGDSNVIRNFPDAAGAGIFQAMYDDVTSAQACRIRSALFHDNVRGIEFTPGVSSPTELFPARTPQPVHPGDTLTFELSTAATTGKALLAVSIYYNQLPGSDARLYSPGQIVPLVRNVKPVYVAVGSGANTAGAWLDLVLTTTESILKAGTDYAVLGLTFDQAVAALAIKSGETGNLRIAVPGGTNNPHGPDYFLFISELTGKPCVPVINANNVGSTFFSIISSAATGAAGTGQVILAELSSNLS